MEAPGWWIVCWAYCSTINPRNRARKAISKRSPVGSNHRPNVFDITTYLPLLRGVEERVGERRSSAGTIGKHRSKAPLPNPLPVRASRGEGEDKCRPATVLH